MYNGGAAAAPPVQLRTLGQKELNASRNKTLLNVHPDKHGSDSTSQDLAKQATVAVNEAWDHVGEAAARELYLAKLRQELMQQSARQHAVAAARVPVRAAAPQEPVTKRPEPSPEEKAPSPDAPKLSKLQAYKAHWKVKVNGSTAYRNFTLKDCAGAQGAECQARRFARLLDTIVLDFRVCPNAAARATYLKKHGLTCSGTIQDMHDKLIAQVCSGKSPECEASMSQAAASSSTSSSSNSVPRVACPQDAKGAEVHHTLFAAAPARKSKHPYIPVYLHPGCFQAVKNKGAKQQTHGLLLGAPHQNTFRVLNMVVSADPANLTLFLQDHMQKGGEQMVLGYIIACPDNVGTLEDQDVQVSRACQAQGSRCYVLVKTTFREDTKGSMKAWNLLDDQTPQVRVHFLSRKREGETFHVLDLDGHARTLRNLTLDALFEAAGQVSAAPEDPAAPPPSAPAPAAPSQPAPEPAARAALRLVPVYPDGRCFWSCCYLAMRPESHTRSRLDNGLAQDKCQQKQEVEEVVQLRDGFLRGLRSALGDLKPACAETREAKSVVEARIEELQAGDQVRLDDLNFMGLLTGICVRCTVNANARNLLPATQHDALYGLLTGPQELHV